jgi:hypothetical protein
MVNCLKCGKINDDDAQYCSKCGSSLTDTLTKSNSFEKQIENFAEEVERVGKKAGKTIEQAAKRFGEETQDIGKRLEKATDRAGNRLENWYDRSFGVFGPLVTSFIGLIILRFVIVCFKIGAQDTPVLGIVSDKLLDYLLLIFVVFLISNYSSYISRKYKPFRWISPIIIAAVIVIISLVVVTILSAVGTSVNMPDLVNAEREWREKYMLITFVIVLLIGYLINVATVAWEKEQIK